MSHTTEQNREIEREKENNTQICYHQHIGSFLFSYQLRRRDKSLALGDQQRDGGKAWKGLLIIITIRQSNNNGEDFVFSFNSHIFTREKEEKKNTHTKQNKSLRTLE